jgi:hypothetical protein
MGFTVYVTFWEAADSNMFGLYPPSPAVDTARILLCIEIVLTYPPAFFSCRDLIIGFLPHGTRQHADGQVTEKDVLLGQHVDTRWWLLPGDERQLIRPFHAVLTIVLWATTVCLALAAPSLGDVLNLVGCATGTGKYSTRLDVLKTHMKHSTYRLFLQSLASYCPQCSRIAYAATRM